MKYVQFIHCALLIGVLYTFHGRTNMGLPWFQKNSRTLHIDIRKYILSFVDFMLAIVHIGIYEYLYQTNFVDLKGIEISKYEYQNIYIIKIIFDLTLYYNFYFSFFVT